MSLCRHYVDKAGALLFCNNTKKQKGNTTACSKALSLQTCSDSI